MALAAGGSAARSLPEEMPTERHDACGVPAAEAQGAAVPMLDASSPSGGQVTRVEEVSAAEELLVTGYQDHVKSLRERKGTRRSLKIDLKLPRASAALGKVRLRKNYPQGDAGRAQWKSEFNQHANKIAYTHDQTSTAKQNMGHLGMFNDYCERMGHGTILS